MITPSPRRFHVGQNALALFRQLVARSAPAASFTDLKNRRTRPEISCQLPVHDGQVELQSYAEISIGERLAVNHLCPCLKIARARSKSWFLFGLPSAPRYDASPMGANVHRHCLIGEQQFFRDYKADWDCHGDALFISSFEAHLTKISPRSCLPVEMGSRNYLQINLTQLSEHSASSRTWLYRLAP